MISGKQATKSELRKLLAEQHKIRYLITQPLSRDELKALVDTLESQTPLSIAIKALIDERNTKAAKNSKLGLSNYQLENKLVDTRRKLSYVEKQLESYKDLARELMQDLLSFEKSEIHNGIRVILNALR